MEDTSALSAKNICYAAGGSALLRGISLNLRAGEIVVLLGTNGAGKSTLLHLLAGVLHPQQGEVLLAGRNVHTEPACRQQLGYLPDRPPLYDELTIEQQLAYAASLFRVPAKQQRKHIDAALEQWQLLPRRKQNTRSLSKGWRQRCGLAQATLHQPAFLLLDEPGEGLDPGQLMHLRESLKEYAQQGMGILLSTHLLEEARHLGDRVLILEEGQIVDELDTNEIQGSDALERHFSTPPAVEVA